MLNLNSHIIVTESRRITWRDALIQLLSHKDMLDNVIFAAIIAKEAKANLIELSPAALQNLVDHYRLENNLPDEQETQEWLSENRLTTSEFAHGIANNWFKQQVIQLITEGKIEEYFLLNKKELKKVSLSKIKVFEEGIAWELHKAIKEKMLDFDKTARRFSIDEHSRRQSGHLGILHYFELSKAIQQSIFLLEENQVSEPLPVATGWELYYPHEFYAPTLDKHTKETIQTLLFKQWLDEQIKNGVLFSTEELLEKTSNAIA